MNRSMSTHKNEALAAPIVPTQGSELATFGAGCFWGVEKSFNRKFAQNGLLAIQVGYIGGAKESPNYQAVCSGRTGYAEAVQLYRMHDPTTLNRQGGDAGTQYRSAIFVHNDAQKKIAQDQTQAAQVHFGSTKIMTTIEPASHFWPAEEYHQRYLDNNPHGYECAMHYERTWDRITALHK
ncbi:peptide-methionine (S)-S-oxide reductase [Batrachochytrium salamandrivorans]|nr:peptide-methionine (S)-S-oxide reductase [Batrachochytrium salamandrivorans]